MAPSIIDSFSDHRAQLVATGVISSAVALSLLLGYQNFERKEKLSALKDSIPSLEEEHGTRQLNSFGATASAADIEDARNQALARRAQAGDFEEELITEQLARNRVFLGDDGLSKLRDSVVVVVGCGGVGSHCAASLARSGVTRLRLVDFDQVTLSSLNRHAVATLADVGIPKVRCLERRLVAIAPWVRFDLRQQKFDEHSAEAMLGAWDLAGDDGHHGRRPDFIVDAIDNIETKVELLKLCHEKELPVISSMGAGCKSDPTRIVVGDIASTTDDGLSRATRRRLKLRGITRGIPTVYSTEKSGEGKAELLPLPEDEFHKGSVGDLGPMPYFRVRILPVLGTMPAIFGLTIANHVILSIAGYPLDYRPAKGREKMYEGILNYVQGSEEKIARSFHPGLVGLKVALTTDDVAFLADDFYRSRSVLSSIPTRIVLIRWRKPAESTVDVIGEGTPDVQRCANLRFSDLVCMTKEEAVRHDREVLGAGKPLDEIYDADTIRRVDEQRVELDRYYEMYRR
ncbi:tRNA threonylcarbamoyladenosine dehydratase [Geosmithia morbida]|uniref:tRNA threonylcarbamoyladenosine dehydratase n=1 Tax=Geosmithia morbida TaxID=1094350 RepID=A0A9P5D2Z6_9HYPO|nr:tRNA threonylcarbamoyladenosine dehydratase [Geosmithia morbida]KAF4124397.1 tRNA threonylcarbamoyladenosine dehydratase [Geosmithia morbida]